MSQAKEKTVKVAVLIEVGPEVTAGSPNDPLEIFRCSWSPPPLTPIEGEESNATQLRENKAVADMSIHHRRLCFRCGDDA